MDPFTCIVGSQGKHPSKTRRQIAKKRVTGIHGEETQPFGHLEGNDKRHGLPTTLTLTRLASDSTGEHVKVFGTPTFQVCELEYAQMAVGSGVLLLLPFFCVGVHLDQFG